MTTLSRFVPAIALLLVAAAPAQQRTLALDPLQTRIEFTVDSTLHTVHGSFHLKRGTIQFDPEAGTAGGEVAADAQSGESGSEARDRKMQKSVLESSRYPEIVFAPDRFEGKLSPDALSQLTVHGIFRIHGVDRELTAPAQVRISGGRMTADMQFVIPYVQWGMKNPSTLFLRVSDKIQINIHAAGDIR